MGFLHQFEGILTNLPTIEKPRFALSFREKIKWTAIILVLYYLLAETPLYGLDPRSVDIFASLRAVMAGNFGSIITLGIGPIVSGSIILQILVGGKLIDLDLSNERDKLIFQGAQKVLAIFFTIFEAAVMVLMGALPPINNDPFLAMLLILQLFIGGLLIIFMDEIVTTWGFGSGIGLFIVANVASQITIGSLNPLPALRGEELPAGRLPAFFYKLTTGAPDATLLIPIIGSIVVFAIVVYFESVRIEIPLTYGRFGGARAKFPLKLIYASNIPVIFASILLANVQLWARMLERIGKPILGTFVANRPVTGLAYYISSPLPFYNPDFDPLQALGYTITLIILSVIFSWFWVETAGMDAKSVAKQIGESRMQIPGFRGDIRIVERLLQRYIPALTFLGGAIVGLLAAFADLLGALGGGMGILLSVGILYQLYELMAREQFLDLYPALRKMLA